MRRLNLYLLAGLDLCAARQPGFSIHQDLLAYPSFEVAFSETFVTEQEAKALIDSSLDGPQPQYEASFSSEQDITSNVQAAPSGANQDADGPGGPVKETYEIMTLPPHRYLCTIPIIDPPPTPNRTATELAKAEEARELARASANGWELLSGLEGTCLYYMSGWWSYSFCYGHDVVQFHALPSKGGAPIRDAQSQEYTLGRVQSPHHASSHSRHGHNSHTVAPTTDGGSNLSPPNTELQVKGDQRYLVQRLEDGTICDLTNRPRTIEIQFHCSPGSTQDRIGWIKEITTCSYLMLVNTPRLCSDVAFLPPREAKANIISCRTILSESEQAQWYEQKTLEAQTAMVGQQEEVQGPITVGGIVVGGRQILGTGEDGEGMPSLEAPRKYHDHDGSLVEIIAMGSSKADGGKLHVLTPEELQDMELSPELIEDLKKKLQELAGDNEWKLEVVETPGENSRELRGVVANDEDEDEHEEDGARKGKSKGTEQKKDEGSEEKFFKEEL